MREGNGELPVDDAAEIQSLGSGPRGWEGAAPAAANPSHSQREELREELRGERSPPSLRHGRVYELGDGRGAACARCHRARVRCVFAKDSRDCVQCARTGHRCTPRIAAADAAQSLQSLLRESGKWLPLLLAGKGTPLEQFRAVRQLIKLSEALGNREPPRRLFYLCAHMFLAAREAQSVSRLHAASCLAAALGIDSPMEWLERPPPAASAEALSRVSEGVHARVLVTPHDGACFVVRSNAGRNEVLVNSTFEFLFTSASMLINHMRAGQVPMVETWPRWIENPQDVHDFMGAMVEAMVLGYATGGTSSLPEQPRGGGRKHSWSCTLPRRIEVRDLSKALFEVTLSAAGSFGDGGLCYAAGVCFHRLRPLNEQAEQRLLLMRGMNLPASPLSRAQADATTEDEDALVALLLQGRWGDDANDDAS